MADGQVLRRWQCRSDRRKFRVYPQLILHVNSRVKLARRLHPVQRPGASGDRLHVAPDSFQLKTRLFSEGLDQWTAKSMELKGRAKEAAGAVTDDEDLRKEGQVDQAKGKVKQSIDKAAQKVKGAIDQVTK
jgi:uncharacterized protein YjbJ (UPF0337 family)